QKEHPTIADAITVVGIVYLESGQAEPGLERVKRAFAMREKALGPYHIAIARNLAIVATAERKARRYKEAEEHLSRAISIEEAAAAGNEADLAAALVTLA